MERNGKGAIQHRTSHFQFGQNCHRCTAYKHPRLKSPVVRAPQIGLRTDAMAPPLRLVLVDFTHSVALSSKQNKSDRSWDDFRQMIGYSWRAVKLCCRAGIWNVHVFFTHRLQPMGSILLIMNCECYMKSGSWESYWNVLYSTRAALQTFMTYFLLFIYVTCSLGVILTIYQAQI